MKIDKFKLIAGGIEGIEVWRTEPVKKGTLISMDQVHRTRKVQIDKPLREKIQKLRYFFLCLTRHWMSPFDKYFNSETLEPMPLAPKDGVLPVGQELLKSLWNDTAITGVSVKEAGFVITGTIECIEGKKMGVSTPFITSEDDFHFYMETMELINEIGDEINKYLYSRLLPIEDAKEQYMLENNLKSLDESQINALTEELITRFQEKGAIILMNSEDDVDALEAPAEGAVTLHQNKAVIAKGRYEEMQGMDEEEEPEQIIIPENKGKVPMTYAVGETTVPEDLSEMEHSENLLEDDQFPE